MQRLIIITLFVYLLLSLSFRSHTVLSLCIRHSAPQDRRTHTLHARAEERKRGAEEDD